ncbi:hypothetical protein CDAR_545991 [Caerostris darwini]|uniref:Uncharacterized protein n=1 Tax=Caerostris darwini TaxID=1538125 RepID=A0AAV4X578_9ARAC|nr:hypothetical protein CDAR_545991 [Caerostris darwini]
MPEGNTPNKVAAQKIDNEAIHLSRKSKSSQSVIICYAKREIVHFKIHSSLSGSSTVGEHGTFKWSVYS